ncbi:ABC transporter ATP-binding protein, partial [Acuticoccus mangrovi]
PRAADRLGQYPHEFSGGQRQRIMIAMALMGRPRLLIADEPTTALDVTIQAQILALLGELQEDLGLALMLITHDLGVVAAIADRIAVMYAGRVVEDGPAAAIFRRPGHPYTRGLIGAIPVPGVTPRGSELAAIPGRVPSLIGGIAGCAFRDRCPEMRPACAEDPVPRHRAAERMVECVAPLAEELAA